ncbi:protein of unknown function [Denitratisoma oestradiolicum]|uniref:Uncharacterized protein n=1 Tax=Denitratisoma oestradiolicum TaxID=311182 RepID=A0A6S6XY87_9PROT|nr:protein of unknown function [Denitratisoma oestradiolicum]
MAQQTFQCRLKAQAQYCLDQGKVVANAGPVAVAPNHAAPFIGAAHSVRKLDMPSLAVDLVAQQLGNQLRIQRPRDFHRQPHR